ncbi:polyprenyl diphosphate synthase [Nocardia sp. NPDC049220]|uniref:polyprenyl diphosphate synthase n=1 Tax=Nocardia sp. NPDC049220 TaxID=3155273 RepID=UPI00340513A5
MVRRVLRRGIVSPSTCAPEPHPASPEHWQTHREAASTCRGAYASTPQLKTEFTLQNKSPLDPDNIPRHVACIPDGNGRWSQLQNGSRIGGHNQGVRVIRDLAICASDLGVEWFTVYAFSTENWQRPELEVRFIASTMERAIYRWLDECGRHNIRIRWIGRAEMRIPRALRRAIDYATSTTKNNTGMTFTIALNYGGRDEIVDAIRKIIENGVDAADLNSELVSRYLYAPDMPDPDLVIRTSGESRISNFLLWQLAYSELVFTSVLWPDFTVDHLRDAIREYQRRDRKFGSIDDGNRKLNTQSQ